MQAEPAYSCIGHEPDRVNPCAAICRPKVRSSYQLFALEVDVEMILQAAADAEVAAIMHWRSSYLVRLMHTIGSSSQGAVRRAAIRMHAMETEAIMDDLAKGHFHTAAGAKVEV